MLDLVREQSGISDKSVLKSLRFTGSKTCINTLCIASTFLSLTFILESLYFEILFIIDKIYSLVSSDLISSMSYFRNFFTKWSTK